MRSTKAAIRNRLECPADFLNRLDRQYLADYRDCETEHEALEILDQISTLYRDYCSFHRLDIHRNNTRFKPEWA